jgi:hypothetical protein
VAGVDVIPEVALDGVGVRLWLDAVDVVRLALVEEADQL